MSDAAGQVAHPHPSRLRRRLGTFETAGCRRRCPFALELESLVSWVKCEPDGRQIHRDLGPGARDLGLFGRWQEAWPSSPQSHLVQNEPRPACTVAGRAGWRDPGLGRLRQLVTSTRSASVCTASSSVAVVRRACQKPKATRTAMIAARTKAEIAAMRAIVARVPNA